jgi:uncharacterized protein (TIGR03437 family)
MLSTLIRVALASALLGSACAQTITTIAGTGSIGGSTGDGGPAIKAGVGFPQGIAVDSSGTVYFADALNGRVRKVDTNGIISTYAGGAFILNGGVGDGGPATSAALSLVSTGNGHNGIALDPQGNLYIADPGHNRVRKVDTNGNISTVAGTGTFGFSGDNGPATSAQLSSPFGVAVDNSGNLIIADSSNGRVRKVDASGTITTIAGSGYGFVTGDGGPATGTKFFPIAVAVDRAGNLYISDFNNHALRKVTNGIITSLYSTGGSTVCSPVFPTAIGSITGIAFDAAGDIFTSELPGCSHKIDTSGKITIYAGGGFVTSGVGDGGPATSALLNNPGDVAVDPAGNVYIADNNDSRVRRIAAPPLNPPAITSVTNAFGGGATIAPNMWVAIKGTNLSLPGDSRIWASADFVNNQLPTQIDGVSATVNGKPAYIYYVSSTQLNILTPPDALSGSVQVQTSLNGAASNTVTVPSASLAPSLFVFDGVHVVGTHLNGTDLGPTTLYPGLTTPAKANETVILYGNGFGPTSVAVVSGSETQSGNLPAFPVVTIGGSPAVVGFAGLISPGLYQFNVTVPASVTSGDAAVTVTFAGQQIQSGVKLAIQ